MTHTHFAYGWINPLMGFGFALAGSFLGLTCMVQARNRPKGRQRLRWLIFGSLAIGGTGIWMMHFIAMIGFTVTDSVVRYDIAITAASLAISIVSVAFGLFVVGMGDPSFAKIAIGGPLTGLGVVAMHYTGMFAVNLSGTLRYDMTWVIASVAIAIIAATVALFFTTWVRGKGSLILASVIMAVAVCGMHYTGMGAISVTLNDRGNDPVPGVDPLLLLIPILIVATIVLIALVFGVLGGREDADLLPERLAAAAEEDPRLRTSPLPTPEPEPALWSGGPMPEQPEPAASRHSAPLPPHLGQPTAASAAAASAHRRDNATLPHRQPDG
ncbi:MAG: MHYT domain-containing protein, partial [Stackebrandtia sp.]